MSKKKLRILLFSTKGAGEHYFGPGMSAYRMYQHADKEEISISLLHGYPEQQVTGLFDKQYFICDLDTGPLSLINFMIRIKNWVRQNHCQFDVVHCLGAFHSSFLVAYQFEKVGVPAFIKITESKHTGFTKSSIASTLVGLKRFRKKNANSISGYIAISNEIKKRLTEAAINESRIYSIPNGVNTLKFKPVENKKKRCLREVLDVKNVFTVLFTGAFSDRKNPFLIVKAFKKFASQANIQLLLVGPDTDNGSHRKKIKEFIEREDLNNIIVRQKVEHIEKYYQVSDLFILPSKEEGMSNSMLEAMACGLPVLVTKVSGAEDVVKPEKNGVFIDREMHSIFNAINMYLNDPELLKANSENAIKTIRNGFKSEQIYQKHIQLFNTTIYN